MKSVLVIEEKDLRDKEEIVIGVADSLESAENFIKTYYGEFTEISKYEINEIAFSKIIEVKDLENQPYKVELTFIWFNIETSNKTKK